MIGYPICIDKSSEALHKISMGTTIPVTYMMWDEERKEPYLQLPSFPDIRLVPYRPGMAEGLVCHLHITICPLTQLTGPSLQHPDDRQEALQPAISVSTLDCRW